MGKVRTETGEMKTEITIMNNDMIDKTEKIHWFERKLNKWVKNFEKSENDSANRHNDLVTKINEVDETYFKECKLLHDTDARINKRIDSIGDANGKPAPMEPASGSDNMS